MYFVPLSQLESVEMLVHCLKAAAGEADCTMCPARKVCMQQCLGIANSVEKMLLNGTLPQLGGGEDGISTSEPDHDPKSPADSSSGKGGLRVVK